jgi:hypothetical protein
VVTIDQISELIPFLEQVRQLAAAGPYILCTDGSADTLRTTFEELFREKGRYKAGAGLVALPAPGLPLGTFFPSLFIPDRHGSSDCAYPMEYIALVLARFTAATIPGCSKIHVDCQSAIIQLGCIPRASHLAALDKVWPDVSRPLNVPVEHVHSHLDNKTAFPLLSRAAQGNCLADRVAEGVASYSLLRLPFCTVDLERLMSCASTGLPEWMRILPNPLGAPSFYHSLSAQAPLARQVVIEEYWKTRVDKSPQAYDWRLGHTRLAAAAAGLSGSHPPIGSIGTIKLIHDKYWWGNRHNLKREPCGCCQLSLEQPFYSDHPLGGLVPAVHRHLCTPGNLVWGQHVSPDDILEGLGHWGSLCCSPKVVRIRATSADLAALLINTELQELRDARVCAHTILGFVLSDPLRFNGRLSGAVTDNISRTLGLRCWPDQLVHALTGCIKIFMEAGKDLYSLQTPGTEIARALMKIAQGKFQAELAAKAKIKRAKGVDKDARAARLEAGRIAETRPAAQPSMLAFVLMTPVEVMARPPEPTPLLGPPAGPLRGVITDFFRPATAGGARALSPCGPSFLSEISTPDPLAPLVVGPAEPSQEEVYNKAVCRYSSSRIKTFLADRTHLQDQLWYALNRFANEFTRMGSFDVPVPLRGVMDDTGSRADWAVGSYGVLWADVLCRLNISFTGWLSITTDVRDNYRRVLGVLHPGDGRREEYGLDTIPRPLPPISKRLAALVSRNQEHAAAL